MLRYQKSYFESCMQKKHTTDLKLTSLRVGSEKLVRYKRLLLNSTLYKFASLKEKMLIVFVNSTRCNVDPEKNVGWMHQLEVKLELILEF